MLAGDYEDGSTPSSREAFHGARHPWNVVRGDMAQEVLEWLRSELALTPGSLEFAALGVSFEKGSKIGSLYVAEPPGPTYVVGNIFCPVLEFLNLGDRGMPPGVAGPRTNCDTKLPAEARNRQVTELRTYVRRAPRFSVISVARSSKTEENRKFIQAGSIGRCSSGSMCGLSLKEPLPLPRLQAWFEAFKFRNALALQSLEASCRAAVLKLPEQERGENGEHLLKTPFREWFLTCGELAITRASGRWVEPLHQDGGASVLHMGVTLYGRRQVKLKQVEGLKDIVIQNSPGTVYISQLTGPMHEVSHHGTLQGELLQLPGLGDCSVTIMMRTALFPACRSRLRNTTPSPAKMFTAVAEALRAGMASSTWKLPTLVDCQSVYIPPEPLSASSPPSPANPQKKQKTSA